MAAEKKTMRARIDLLVKEKGVLEKDHEKSKEKVKQLKGERLAIQTAMEDQSVPLRFCIEEEALKPFFIEKAAYWGKLVGNGCRRLLGNATAIMEIIEEMLLQEAEHNNMDTEGTESMK